MRRTKQLLPWPTDAGDIPLVAAAFDAVAWACDSMVVVLGHDAEAVADALGARNFHRVESNPDAQMFDSACAGLLHAHRLDRSADLLLQPADHPRVERDTLDALIQAGASTSAGAVIPEFDGTGGHPVLVRSAMVCEILQFGGEGGLRKFWSQHPGKIVRVRVDDKSVRLGINTPSDYAAAVR